MIEVEVEDEGWIAAEPRAQALAAIAACAALDAEGGSGAGELAILLTDDARQQALNARFRGKDAPTNVLSFPAPASAPGQLGDISLACGVCAREAAEQGKPLSHHLQHMTAHGVLHLLGYDHLTDAQAESMEAKERAILAGLGIPDPYADRR